MEIRFHPYYAFYHKAEKNMPANSEPLQGSLFEDLEAAETTIHDTKVVNRDFCQEISDQELVEDAKQRPRQRMEEQPEAETRFSPKKSDQGVDPEDNLPKWSHHSLLNAEELTPMLRHYVELKSLEPDRILLYRLGDFF